MYIHTYRVYRKRSDVLLLKLRQDLQHEPEVRWKKHIHKKVLFLSHKYFIFQKYRPQLRCRPRCGGGRRRKALQADTSSAVDMSFQWRSTEAFNSSTLLWKIAQAFSSTHMLHMHPQHHGFAWIFGFRNEPHGLVDMTSSGDLAMYRKFLRLAYWSKWKFFSSENTMTFPGLRFSQLRIFLDLSSLFCRCNDVNIWHLTTARDRIPRSDLTRLNMVVLLTLLSRASFRMLVRGVALTC
jgi:hypothetical protein